MPTEKPRVTFMISEEKLAELESYRFDNKIKNQSQAVLSLIDKGLSALEAEKAADTKNSPSAAEAAPEAKKAPLYSSEAMKLAQDYDSLDSYGKRMVRMVVIEEKVRCEEQGEAPAPNMIYAAAKDGGRPESETDCKIVLPEEDTQIPR